MEVPFFQHLTYYTWDKITSTFTVLLTSKLSEDTSTIHRNVVALQYSQDIVTPFIKQKLKLVKCVKALLSRYLRFDDAVQRNGGHIEHPNYWDTPIK